MRACLVTGQGLTQPCEGYPNRKMATNDQISSLDEPSWDVVEASRIAGSCTYLYAIGVTPCTMG